MEQYTKIGSIITILVTDSIKTSESYRRVFTACLKMPSITTCFRTKENELFTVVVWFITPGRANRGPLRIRKKPMNVERRTQKSSAAFILYLARYLAVGHFRIPGPQSNGIDLRHSTFPKEIITKLINLI